MGVAFSISMGAGFLVSSVTEVAADSEVMVLPKTDISLNVSQFTGVMTALLLSPMFALVAAGYIPKFRKERKAGLVPYFDGIVVFNPQNKTPKEEDIDWKEPSEWFGKLEFETSKGDIFFFKILNSRNKSILIPVHRKDFHEILPNLKNGRINGYFKEAKLNKYYTSTLVRPYTTRKTSKY
jgi:hypothetical protein